MMLRGVCATANVIVSACDNIEKQRADMHAKNRI